MRGGRAVLDRVRRRLRRQARAYGAGQEQRLKESALSLAAFSAYGAAWAVLLRRTGGSPAARLRPGDAVLASLATFRLSRLLSKGSVTSLLRAPFTEFEGATGPSEISERARGEGARATVGALVTCPFCTGVWVVTTLTGAQILWPQTTRTITWALATLAGADAAQLAYDRLVSWCQQ
ncbi:DUF1360 domain-containing protein [Streptomyces sp. NPDC101132]|uniref:DUF1360 domain-containing protein n=1 Tax=Streptomyces sp. NPDC101132 TaxID=3366110 RepID=UPI00380A2CD9